MSAFYVPDDLPQRVRDKIAQEWLTAGQMEHASVASFARFSLQLMALAAPPSLLEQSHMAGLDEIKHAKLCFRMASAYLGRPVGPGKLPIDDALLGDGALVDVAVATVHEGCIGETIGTLEAAEALRLAQDPEVRAVWSTVRDDEARHGDLAWAFVRWAILQATDAQRATILGAFDTIQVLDSSEPAPDPDEALMRQHGCLTPRCRYRVREAMLREVIAPAVEALRAL